MNTLFINFKTFEQGTGRNALKLAVLAEACAKKTGEKIVLVVQATDIRLLSENVSLDIFAQHVDPIEFGSHTGSILPEAVKSAGAKGTVLNHAENKRNNDFLQNAIVRAHNIGLKVMVCAETVVRAKEIASFFEKPDFIAVEPPELIGGKVSVSSANPKIISDTVAAVHAIANIPVITGAGINSTEDVRKAIELGTNGVFVASSIVKSPDPEKAIMDLLKGF